MVGAPLNSIREDYPFTNPYRIMLNLLNKLVVIQLDNTNKQELIFHET